MCGHIIIIMSKLQRSIEILSVHWQLEHLPVGDRYIGTYEAVDQRVVVLLSCHPTISRFPTPTPPAKNTKDPNTQLWQKSQQAVGRSDKLLGSSGGGNAKLWQLHLQWASFSWQEVSTGHPVLCSSGTPVRLCSGSSVLRSKPSSSSSCKCQS